MQHAVVSPILTATGVETVQVLWWPAIEKLRSVSIVSKKLHRAYSLGAPVRLRGLCFNEHILPSNCAKVPLIIITKFNSEDSLSLLVIYEWGDCQPTCVKGFTGARMNPVSVPCPYACGGDLRYSSGLKVREPEKGALPLPIFPRVTDQLSSQCPVDGSKTNPFQIWSPA